MGYGKRALRLLRDYYEGKFADLNEDNMEKQGTGKLLIEIYF